MKKLLKYWYIIVLALVLSLSAALGLIFMRQDAWMPVEEEEKDPVNLEEGDSESFREWRFRANELESLQLKLDARAADLDAREKSFASLQGQIESERAELIRIRKSLEELRDSIEKNYITIEAQELSNIQRLALIYSEVKPDAAIKVFEALDDEEIVKILSLMSTESSARVLGEMGASDNPKLLQRASRITSDLRKVKQ
jgi:flagellar motility protein MotE (MotC chaperone)